MTKLTTHVGNFVEGIQKSVKRQHDDEPGGGWADGNSGLALSAFIPGATPLLLTERQFDERAGGGAGDLLWDVVSEHERGGDWFDLPGPSLNDAADDAGDAAKDLTKKNPLIGAALTAVVVAAFAYALGQLFTFEVGS